MTDSTITKTIFLSADAETVWAYLTDKDKLGEWFHHAESSLTEGEDYVLVGDADDGSSVKKCWGSVVESTKPERLKYTFTVGPLNGAMTTVTWELQEVHGGTRLSLLHEGISEAAGGAALPLLLALDAGWDAHLGKLRGTISKRQ